MTEPLTLLSRALDQVSTVLDQADPGQADRPTPCPLWDVATLAGHVVFDADQFAVAARGDRIDWSQSVPELTGDWRVAFDSAAEGLMAAWAEVPDLSEPVTMQFGPVPRTFLVNQQLAEFSVHAWDLARSIDHSGQLDQEVAAIALGWATQTLQPQMRGAGKAFGAEVTVPDDAPPMDRLVGFFGRDPHWSAN